MSRYFFSARAKLDLKELNRRIARDNPAAARRLLAEIKRKAKAVADFPEMGRSYSYLVPSLRGFLVEDYVILYFPQKNSIQVSRVLSGYCDLEAIFRDDTDEI